MKIIENKFIKLVLYVTDIFLIANDSGLIYNIKNHLSNNFEMKDKSGIQNDWNRNTP